MRLCLRVLNAPEGEVQHTLAPPGGLLGRSNESTIQLAYDSVSRQHAELCHDGSDWWIQNRSQASFTMLDEEPVATGTSKRLAARGVLKLGRVMLSYEQEPLPASPEPGDAEPALAGPATLVLPRRASLDVPQSVLLQMSPVRAPRFEPASAPPTLLRRASAVPPQPKAAAEETPPTLIRPNRPPVSPPQVLAPVCAERPFASAPATLVRKQPQPVAEPNAADGAEPASRSPEAATPGVEPAPQRQEAVCDTAWLAQAQSERDRLEHEIAALTAEIAKLKQENAELRDAQAAAERAMQAGGLPPPSASEPARDELTSFREKARELLTPFGQNLERAGEAMREGDVTKARSLLRAAAFTLADLRDLFQS